MHDTTVKLQSSTLDILHAYEKADDLKDVYRKLRLNVDTNFKLIYDEAVKLAERVDAPVRKPRIIGKQQHRSNADSVSIYDHYKKNLVIPFLDHVSNQLNDRFS